MRHKRVRARVIGTSERPRLCVFRSNKYIYAQLIDDPKGRTLVSASSQTITNESLKTKKSRSDNRSFGAGASDLINGIKKSELVKALKGKSAAAYRTGEILAKKAIEKGINTVVFDRGGYKYHGRAKALAEGAKKGGLKF